MDQAAPQHLHPRRRRRFAALLALAIASGSLGAGALSLAIFTDSQAVTGNAFSTGTIDISTTPATALFTVSSMMPGDSTTATIQVNNAGTGALRYAISTAVVSGADACRPAPAGRLRRGRLHGHGPLQRGARCRRRRQQRPGRPGGRPRPRRRVERDALLQGDPAARHRQRVPEHVDERDLHLRRRADGEQLASWHDSTRPQPEAICSSARPHTAVDAVRRGRRGLRARTSGGGRKLGDADHAGPPPRSTTAAARLVVRATHPARGAAERAASNVAHRAAAIAAVSRPSARSGRADVAADGSYGRQRRRTARLLPTQPRPGGPAHDRRRRRRARSSPRPWSRRRGDATHWTHPLDGRRDRAMQPRARSAGSGGPSPCAPAPERDVQALHRSAVHREGPRHRRAVPRARPSGRVVLSVDEKTQVQALDRTRSRCCRMLPEHRTSARTLDYVRHGTPACSRPSTWPPGKVIGDVPPRATGRSSSGAFLDADRRRRSRPTSRSTSILDNVRDPQDAARSGAGSLRHPRFHLHFTPDRRLLAQPRPARSLRAPARLMPGSSVSGTLVISQHGTGALRPR